ncbi:heat-shock protein [Halobacteriales archaeon QS_4_62_28]|nr:MAG: heat-shock protein [Halobacteriales archaeon QS_4_62_28]
MGDPDTGDSNRLEEIERVIGLMSDQFGTHRQSVPVDVIDTGDQFVVHADLPGLSADDIDVRVSDNHTLTLAAERAESETDGRYVTRERKQQAARRTVRLPDAVDADETSASYDAGVLTVELDKATSDDETAIPVN